MNDLQLEMNFTGETGVNRLRQQLDQGEFVLLMESRSPGKDLDPAAAGERLAELEQQILEIRSIPTALAVLDGGNSGEFWRAAEFAGALSPENRDRHLFYLSGRNTDDAALREIGGLALRSGVRNLITVSGDAARGEDWKGTRQRTFLESTEMLKKLEKSSGEMASLLLGGVVNPFQYSAPSIFAQYAKLMKKLSAGAQLIVTQAGWDMLKLQALRWYLCGRNCFVPTIARLILLTPERVEKILAGQEPGVNISRDFSKILDQELRFSRTQFEAAQWRRLELQAAGCRLLGFSGIQLAGAENAARMKIAAERIANALKQYNSFDGWLEDYNSYMARAEMAPLSGSFYLYDRTLKRTYPDQTPAISVPESLEITAGERFRYWMRQFLFPHADQQDPRHWRMLKHMTAGCRDCRNCRLPQSHFLCPEHCPKGLSNGPCGGIRPDGSCEIAGLGECVHRKIMRLAMWRGDAVQMEDQWIPSGK